MQAELKALKEELDSETKWAKQYHDELYALKETESWDKIKLRAELTKVILDGLPKEKKYTVGQMSSGFYDMAERNAYDQCLSEVITSIKKTMGEKE